VYIFESMESKRKTPLPFWAQKLIVIAFLYSIFGIGYLSINALHAGKDAVCLKIFIDDLIPFNRHWIWFYYLYFPFILFPIIFLRDYKELTRATVFYLITAFITLIVFAFWRTTMIRPEIVGNDLSARLLKRIYDQDHPYNCFPSQHVAYSWVAAFIAVRRDRFFGYASFVIAILISLSTVFIKQHWFVDIPGGIGVALIAYLLTYHIIFKVNLNGH